MILLKKVNFGKNVAKELGIIPLQSDNPKDVEAFQNWVAQELPNYFGKEILTSGAFAGSWHFGCFKKFFLYIYRAGFRKKLKILIL